MDGRTIKWIWLSCRCGAESHEFLQLFDFFGSLDNIYNATFSDYTAAGLSEALATRLEDKSFDKEYKIAEYCQRYGARIITFGDKEYPAKLREIQTPPIVLYCLGSLKELNEKLCISIVGTRRMSEYGMRAAYKIAYEVASADVIVVSGMALGIDGVAASAAISSGGQTIAVLGCGIDRVYPPEHKKLKEIIKFHGAIITEYPPMTEPSARNFPARNRIISGLSHGTVIVDADKKSGAMITANYAALQGRDIYAVPGNIDHEGSSGTNSLIQDGAIPVMNGRDVITNYAYAYPLEIINLDIVIAENRSEFNAEVLQNMGINARIGGDAVRRGGQASARVHSEPIIKVEVSQEQIKFVPSQEHEVHDADKSSTVLASLNDKQRKIFEAMPFDHAVTVDSFASLGYSAGEIMSSLSMLEIKGLIQSLPGALYIRK